ncbi:hypothetical protein LGK95_21455 [Clostridium algoriphilum]|uniref:hypothetical protein n=1 Tax=Clostridium algoriphilum TaxID=198347 RepID=UPI001CF22914|nr:hypothetical protein [Clostridium algoriphilum]MCB2296021.1 hypothetical protein [Clostridium algoriphilum]
MESLENRLDAKIKDLYEKLGRYDKTIKFLLYSLDKRDIKVQIEVLEEIKNGQ